MFSSPKCPKCGAAVSAQAKFCGTCGATLPGGRVRCSACGAENKSDALYCNSCGRPLGQSASAEIQRHRWARRPEDLAVRIEADDLPGTLRQGLIVEPGTQVMLVIKGQAYGPMPPGEYALENVLQRFADWVATGIPERATALLVDTIPADLVFNLGGGFTADNLPIGVSVRVQLEVADAGKFLINMLGGRERYSKEDLRQYLYPEVSQVMLQWLRAHSLQQMVENPVTYREIQEALEAHLETTLKQTGLRVIQVRTAELNLEPYDRVKGIRAKYSLQIEEMRAEAEGQTDLAEAQIKARQRWLSLQKEIDLQELGIEALKVEKEESKIELFQRMRSATMSDKMNEVRSETEFEAYLNQIDHQKLLSEKERNEMLRQWKEDGEDHELARAHLNSRLEVEQKYELRMLQVKLQGELDTAQLDNEIAIARKRADYEIEMRRKQSEEALRLEQDRARIEMERRRLLAEQERLERQQAFEDETARAKTGLELLATMKEMRRLDEKETKSIEREHELALENGRLELRLKEMEAVERLRLASVREDHEYELKRMAQMAQMGAEALIAYSGPEQGRLLADLKRTEALKGMTEEQILAMAAEHSPEVARAFQERYRAVAEGQASQREREMYERMLQAQGASQKEITEILQRSQQETIQTVKDISTHNVDAMRDLGIAYAQSGGGSSPVVITGSGLGGGPQVISTGTGGVSAQQMGSKVCPKCGIASPIDARFCEHCGNKFEGMN